MKAPPQRETWSYRLFGPTTLHLQHEFYLWISLSLLPLATLKSLYRDTLLEGDVMLLLLISFWLSRHFSVRWIVSNDTFTAKNPTLLGIWMHWMTSYVTAGQYMDRPDPQVVSKNVGIPSDEPICLLPSLSYTLHYLYVRILYPIWNLKEKFAPNEQAPTRAQSFSTRRSRSSTGNTTSSWRNSTYFKWIVWWRDHGPSLQMLFASMMGSIMVLDLIYTVYPPARSTNDIENHVPRGIYQTLEAPSRLRLLLFLARTPVLLTIFWYGRVALPIPDLVAGANVLKSVRAEALLHGQSTNASGKSSKIKHQFVTEDAPWAERFKSIALENRFRLACKVAGIRIVDGLLACTVLPRTSLACRLTGHCPERPALWELSSILNPIGLTGPLPTNGSKMLRSINPDRGSLVIIMLSVLIITSLLLLAQAVVLNGSFYAIMGYVSGEWTLVENPPQYFEAPAAWDPKRRYKKGDLIVHSGFGGGVYRASTNNPEGRPFDLCLRVTHDFFRSELGHSSTSRIIALATKVQMAFMSVIFCLIAWYWLRGYNTGALWTAFMANLIACYGLVTVGLMDYNELATVANEVQPASGQDAG